MILLTMLDLNRTVFRSLGKREARTGGERKRVCM